MNEPDFSYGEERCPFCDGTREKQENAQEFMIGVINQLSGKEPFNVDILFNDLDMVCHYLGLKIKISELKIERKKD